MYNATSMIPVFSNTTYGNKFVQMSLDLSSMNYTDEECRGMCFAHVQSAYTGVFNNVMGFIGVTSIMLTVAMIYASWTNKPQIAYYAVLANNALVGFALLTAYYI